MKPYFDDGLVTLYHGDCQEISEWLAADALITDPPYGISYKTSSSRTSGLGTALAKDWPEIHGDDKPFDPSPFLGFETVVLFGANHFADKLPASSGWIVWDKLNGLKSDRAFGFNDSSDIELAWTNRKMPARVFNHTWIGAMRETEKLHRTLHPTQKPVKLMQWVINGMTNPGQVIADPFAGSGSTLVAAQRLGRRAIGVEIEEKYCETTALRLSQQPLDLGQIA